ncbi:MAG TPA: hypothetical protein VGH28_20495 [Polyangiaceae bacterium]|jgi:hypothetical protein
MRALGFLLAASALTFAAPAGAARVTDHGDLAIDIDAPGTKVCHYSDQGPVDGAACTPEERVTFSNLTMLEPHAFAALVFHFRAWQASVVVTRSAPTHSTLAEYARAMRAKTAGTNVQIAEAPRLVLAPSGAQIIVSAIHDPTKKIVTRNLEIRGARTTYRVLFSGADDHAAEVTALSDRALRTVVAR